MFLGRRKLQALGAAWRGFLTRYSFLLLRQAVLIVQAWARGWWSRRKLHGVVHVILVRGSRLKDVATRGKQSPVVRITLEFNGVGGVSADSGIAIRGGRDPEWAPTRGEGLVRLPYSVQRVVMAGRFWRCSLLASRLVEVECSVNR